jgi:Flp pilus assembly protein TadB
MAMRYYAPLSGPEREPFPAVGPRVLRIGDAERDAAAADLGEHFVAGRISLDELHERLGDVFSAKTQGQLSRIMADLPGPRRPARPTMTSRVARSPAQTAAAQQRAGYDTPSDRAGRFAALALLILAMLIWLFTALVFARHGFYHEPGPFGPPGPH